MDCSSAYATEVGARSCEKRGEGILILAKWAACPASCMRVVSPVSPEPTAAGSASEVKWVTVGCHVPSGFCQAGCGLSVVGGDSNASKGRQEGCA